MFSDESICLAVFFSDVGGRQLSMSSFCERKEPRIRCLWPDEANLSKHRIFVRVRMCAYVCIPLLFFRIRDARVCFTENWTKGNGKGRKIQWNDGNQSWENWFRFFSLVCLPLVFDCRKQLGRPSLKSTEWVTFSIACLLFYCLSSHRFACLVSVCVCVYSFHRRKSSALCHKLSWIVTIEWEACCVRFHVALISPLSSHRKYVFNIYRFTVDQFETIAE